MPTITEDAKYEALLGRLEKRLPNGGEQYLVSLSGWEIDLLRLLVKREQKNARDYQWNHQTDAHDHRHPQ